MQNAMPYRYHIHASALLVLIASVGTSNARAQDFLENEPNLKPTTGLFMTMAPVLRERQWTIDTIVASQAARETRGQSSALFDGETTQYRLGGNFAVTDQLRVGFSAQYRTHRSGQLDPFIDSWHKAFGLPEGIRDDRPRDALDFQWTERGTDVINLSDRQKGFGDTHLHASYRLSAQNEDQGSWFVAGAIKLGTGDSDRLTGSGRTDIGVTLQYRSAAQPNRRWLWNASVGSVWLGDADLNAFDQRSVLFNGQVSLILKVTKNFSLGARLQAHSAVAQSELSMIGDPVAQLVTGGEWRFRKQTALRITVAEDVIVEHSPDVTFKLGLAHAF